jgi:uncharacterized protein (TIGR03067 family)
MNDHESLQGFWKLISAFHGGKEYEPADAGTLSQFIGNRFRHIRTRMSSRFELLPETMPKGMDFVQVSTKFIVRAIYELQGDSLRIGRPQSPFHPRPNSFEDALVVEVYQRFRRRVHIKRRVKAQIPSGMGSFTKGLLNDIQVEEIPER